MKSKFLLLCLFTAALTSCNQKSAETDQKSENVIVDLGQTVVSNVKFPVPESMMDTTYVERLNAFDAEVLNRKKFLNIILMEVLNGKLKTYETADADAKELDLESVKSKFILSNTVDTVVMIDPVTMKETMTVINNTLGLDTIKELNEKSNKEEVTYSISDRVAGRFSSVRFIESVAYNTETHQMTKIVKAVGLSVPFYKADGAYLGDQTLYVRF